MSRLGIVLGPQSVANQFAAFRVFLEMLILLESEYSFTSLQSGSVRLDDYIFEHVH